MFVLHARPRGGVSHELTIGRAVEVRPPLWVSRRPRSTPHPSAHSPTRYVMWGTLGVTDVHGAGGVPDGGEGGRRKGASRGRERRRGPVGPRAPVSSSSAAGTRGRYYRVRQPPPVCGRMSALGQVLYPDTWPAPFASYGFTWYDRPANTTAGPQTRQRR